MNLIKQLLKNKKGAAMVEYALLVAGVALISAGGVSVFGHKTSDLIGTTAAVLPGAHLDDNNPIASGHIIETAVGAGGSIGVSAADVVAANNTSRLDANTGLGAAGTDSILVTETP
jgi:Flp pilus assembly pilin Flp